MNGTSPGNSGRVPDSLIIRDAIPEEATAILDLQHRAYQEAVKRYDDPHLPPLIQTIEDLILQFDTYTILVAMLDSTVIGSVRAREHEDACVIERLIVEPAMHNHGIGTKLLHAVEQRFPQTCRFELFTGHKSTRNLYLYESRGYRRIREEPVHETLTLIHLAKDGSCVEGQP